MRKALLIALLLACFATPAHAFWPRHAGGTPGGGSYTGPCDLITGGCAEAWSMTRAMTAAYQATGGPYFQLALYATPTTTLDIGPSNMGAWTTFCGGTLSNCSVPKIYAQINGHANDLISAGTGCTVACGCTFALTSTGTPQCSVGVLNVLGNTAAYFLNNDQVATGITGGSESNLSDLIVGFPVAQAGQCCGSFNIAHALGVTDVQGTDFGIGMQYSNTNCCYVNCPAPNVYCLNNDLEGNGSPEGISLGGSPFNVVSMITWTWTTNIFTGTVNGVAMWTPQAPPFALNPGECSPATAQCAPHIHVGAGGDGSGPATFTFYEGLFTNTAIDNTDYSAVLSNVEAAYPGLSFPTP